LAERLCEQIRAWDGDRTAQPVITAYPAGTPNGKLLSGPVINKRHIRLVVSY
jgi:protein-L-isoaspartate(D-aspartate) O-methyltransferase